MKRCTQLKRTKVRIDDHNFPDQSHPSCQHDLCCTHCQLIASLEQLGTFHFPFCRLICGVIATIGRRLGRNPTPIASKVTVANEWWQASDSLFVDERFRGLSFLVIL